MTSTEDIAALLPELTPEPGYTPAEALAAALAFIDQQKSSYISGFVVGASGEIRSYVYTQDPKTTDSARKGILTYKRA